MRVRNVIQTRCQHSKLDPCAPQLCAFKGKRMFACGMRTQQCFCNWDFKCVFESTLKRKTRSVFQSWPRNRTCVGLRCWKCELVAQSSANSKVEPGALSMSHSTACSTACSQSEA